MSKMDKQFLEIEKLPTGDLAKISDAFSMKVTGSSVVDKIDQYPAEKDALQSGRSRIRLQSPGSSGY